MLPGAMCAAVHVAALLQAMSDDTAAAMGAGRCQRVNGTLEAVERVRPALPRVSPVRGRP